MVTKSKSTLLSEIRTEFKKIDQKWLNLHYQTFVGFVLFGLIIEFVLALIIYREADVIISFSIYFAKYMLIPLMINLCLVLIGKIIMRLNFSIQLKSYVISLLLVGVSFVFYSVHIIFDSLYMIFTIPILLTVIYNDYKLTTVISIVSMVAKVSSQVFVKWDSDKIEPFGTVLGSMNFGLSIFIMFCFYIACIIVIYFEKEKNNATVKKEIQRAHMKQKLITDELTRIFNRTALRNALDHMMADETDSTYAFAMLDLDHFKTLNDTMGHDEGDKALREFAKILKKNSVSNVWAYRFGGDEFCLLFKNKDTEEIKSICYQIQMELESSAIYVEELAMTTSIGIASYQKGMSATQLLKNTDTALYAAKRMRNLICVYEEIVERKESSTPHAVENTSPKEN